MPQFPHIQEGGLGDAPSLSLILLFGPQMQKAAMLLLRSRVLITSVGIGPAFVVFYLLSLPQSPQARIPSFPPKGIHSHTCDVWPQLHTLKITVSVVCQPPREHLKATDPEASQLQRLRAEPSFLSVTLNAAHLLLGGCTKPHLCTAGTSTEPPVAVDGGAHWDATHPGVLGV